MWIQKGNKRSLSFERVIAALQKLCPTSELHKSNMTKEHSSKLLLITYRRWGLFRHQKRSHCLPLSFHYRTVTTQVRDNEKREENLCKFSPKVKSTEAPQQLQHQDKQHRVAAIDHTLLNAREPCRLTELGLQMHSHAFQMKLSPSFIIVSPILISTSILNTLQML